MKVAFSAGRLGSKPGLVVALPDEGRALAGRNWGLEDGRWVCRTATEQGRELLWVRSGVGPERALAAARWLIGQKVSCLAVLGVSGGLAPGLVPGQLIVAETIIEGEEPGRHWDCPEGKLLLEALRHAGMDPILGPVVTVVEPVLTPAEKQRLHTRTGALAVDMESAAVARAAAEEGLNCLVLRAVCDGPDRLVPPALYRMVDGEGRLRIAVLLRELLRRPRLIHDLLAMRQDFAEALTALKKAKDICWTRINADKRG